MLNFSWLTICKEIEKIVLLYNEVEKATRFQLIYDILNKINDYNDHISNFDYTQKWQEIINRGIIFIPYSKPSTLKANWSKLFAASVSTDEKKEIRYDNYKWHIFSFEKVNALSHSKARQSFNRCKKEKVYVFYQLKKEAYYIENPQLLKSSDFDLEQDVYIFDLDKKWTYVHTHEAQCGQYFYQLK